MWEQVFDKNVYQSYLHMNSNCVAISEFNITSVNYSTLISTYNTLDSGTLNMLFEPVSSGILSSFCERFRICSS